MPSYSLNSPSLKKYDMGIMDSRRSQFSGGNIIGDPFALITVSLSLGAWLLAFIPSIIADVGNPYPKYAWWTIAYMLCCIIGITLCFATNSVNHYNLAIVGYLAAGLVMTTSAVNSLIYQDQGSMQAAAAGFVLLSIVVIVWIFYFGSSQNSTSREYVDQFAMNKERSSMYRGPVNNYNAPETTLAQPPQMYTSAQLNGFETSSPVSGYPGGPMGTSARGSAMPPTATAPTTAAATTNEGNQTIEYPYRAKAIYSYEANPDGANEISFSKHEILEVSDVSGRWWQAKKENGDTGIAPSNYLILL